MSAHTFQLLKLDVLGASKNQKGWTYQKHQIEEHEVALMLIIFITVNVQGKYLQITLRQGDTSDIKPFELRFFGIDWKLSWEENYAGPLYLTEVGDLV